MAIEETAPDTDTRIGAIAKGADLTHVADSLALRRDEILERWLAAASRQPFHLERPAGAVADHIPRLFDALVALLRRDPGADGRAVAPLDDPAVLDEAGAHAQVRFEQGLGPVAVVTEFRLLRQEIARSLGTMLDDDVQPFDVVGGLAMVGDALDGAATIGLTALSDRIESLRETFLATTLHDMRQPITLLEGSLVLADRWAKADDPDLERVRERITDALAASIELVSMVDTLSDASLVATASLRSNRNRSNWKPPSATR